MDGKKELDNELIKQRNILEDDLKWESWIAEDKKKQKEREKHEKKVYYFFISMMFLTIIIGCYIAYRWIL